MVRWSRSIGVLSLQNREIHEYSRLEIEILETVAMVLSEMIVSEEMTEYKKSLIKARGLASRERVKGLSLSKGYGIGKAVVHRRRQTVSKIFAEDREKELKRTLTTVYEALLEKGYNPINQLVGYILSEDPTYITTHNNARALIRHIDRDELLQVLLRSYLER